MKIKNIKVGMQLIRTERDNGSEGAKIGQVAKVVGFYLGWPIVTYEGCMHEEDTNGQGEVWCPAFCKRQL